MDLEIIAYNCIVNNLAIRNPPVPVPSPILNLRRHGRGRGRGRLDPSQSGDLQSRIGEVVAHLNDLSSYRTTRAVPFLPRLEVQDEILPKNDRRVVYRVPLGRFIKTTEKQTLKRNIKVSVDGLVNDSWISGDFTIHVKVGKELRSKGWEKVDAPNLIRYGQALAVYKVLNANSQLGWKLIICPQPRMSDFLSSIPDQVPLGELTLPGTHESCALYGWPISQCQQPSTPISQQLEDGVRFLDIRLRVVGDELQMYHGPRPQRSTFPTLLSCLYSFLSAHPSETIILSIKEESPPFNPLFSHLVWKSILPELERWFLENRIPTLGEVRGKIILLSRFERNLDQEEKGEWQGVSGEAMGIHPSTWPDSRRDGFEWECHGTTVRTQDWYRVPTFLHIPEKFSTVQNHLSATLTSEPLHCIPAPPYSTSSPTDRTSTSTPDTIHTDTSSEHTIVEHPTHKSYISSQGQGHGPLTISFSSASSFPLSPPMVIAKGLSFFGIGVKGVNDRLMNWLLETVAKGERVRGCVIMDFYRQGVEVGVLVGMNFLGREEEDDVGRVRVQV